jgi:DNA/RNA-binding domain of Phe-tRNA-synthetase-like protein
MEGTPVPRVRMHPDVIGRVRAFALWLDGVEVTEAPEAFEELERIAQEYRSLNEGSTVGRVEGVAEARRLYRTFGIDPTSTRPSSEALLKRALAGRPLYHVNNVVDWGNAAALAGLLPLGLYDRDRIVGEEVLLRQGEPGEEFAGIRKGPVHVAGRLCVADAEGAFGSPTSDSHRTRITAGAGRILAVVFGPADGEAERLERTASILVDGLERHASARLAARRILP